MDEDRRERADRILDVAGDLVERWGYQRVTIEDVASRAGIGKGTIYLHWKNRLALFYAVLARESVRIFDQLLAGIRRDPVELLPHRMMPNAFRLSMARPLLNAMITKDSEVLGKLVEVAARDHEARDEPYFAYLRLLRSHGLLRTDQDVPAQAYQLEVITGGAALLEPWLTPGLNLPLDDKVGALTHLILAAIEPPGPPDRARLAAAVPDVLELFDGQRATRLSAVYDQPVETPTGT